MSEKRKQSKKECRSTYEALEFHDFGKDLISTQKTGQSKRRESIHVPDVIERRSDGVFECKAVKHLSHDVREGKRLGCV